MLPTRHPLPAPGSTILRPSSGLRGLAPATGPVISAAEAPRRPTFAESIAGVIAGCRLARASAISRSARDALGEVELETSRGSLLRQLADLQTAGAPEVREEKLWIMRRLDGSLVGLYRLMSNGEVGLYPHPNESRWSLVDNTLRFHAPNGDVTTEFNVHGQHQGQQVFVGLFKGDDSAVHVLSEVNCYYAKLRALDPASLGALARAMQAEPLPDFGLPDVPAVVLAAPRTGSHLLLNLLNSTGQVFFDAELFNFEKISVFGEDLPSKDTRALSALRSADPVQFAKVMLTRSHHVDGRMLDRMTVRGFKLFPEHSPAVMRWIMEESKVRIVHLHRPNLLAEFSSLVVASSEGHWLGGPAALKQHRIRFDAERFARFVDSRRADLESIRGRLAKRDGRHVEIAYGDFTRSNLSGVLSFLLGRPSTSQFDHLGIKRQLNERIIERFDDPDGVMSCLSRMGVTEWAESEMKDVATL